MQIKNLLFALFYIPVSIAALVTLEEKPNGLQLTTLYGTTLVHEPVLIRLIQHPAFERLQKIHQYGATQYTPEQKWFSRYEHSLGVFFLVRMFGAELTEQIAALLHDVSHTVFSHVGDVLFKSEYRSGKDAYQDTIHEWYLEQVNIMTLLREYGHASACTCAAKKAQRCFDQPLPNLCADRIEYNLSGAFLDGLITTEEIQGLLRTLHFAEGEWFFDDLHMAKKFGMISLQLTELRWGSPWGVFVDYAAAQALQRGMEIDLFSADDIHFSTDEIIWNKLMNSNDAPIAQWIEAICRAHMGTFPSSCAPVKDVLHLSGKFSGTNPFVTREGELVRLSTLDAEYQKAFGHLRQQITQGVDMHPMTLEEAYS